MRSAEPRIELDADPDRRAGEPAIQRGERRLEHAREGEVLRVDVFVQPSSSAIAQASWPSRAWRRSVTTPDSRARIPSAAVTSPIRPLTNAV